MYNNEPTTCFGRFLTGHHQVGIQCQRNYISNINIDIIISVSTEKRGGRDLVPPPLFCAHTDTNIYIYSRYIVSLTLYSKLMMAS